MALVECIPNVSDGRNPVVIETIARRISEVESVQLLHVDVGFDANRTVFTFAGPPNRVLQAAYNLIETASEYIDMRTHKGEHARNGAVDVCPFVPISHVTMTECVTLATQLGQKVGTELQFPVYLYEEAATRIERKNLAFLRKGQYESLARKISTERWHPDFGPNRWDDRIARFGAIQIGARPFLIAYNINLDTVNVAVAKAIARIIRTSGGHPQLDEQGQVVRNQDGKTVRTLQGLFTHCKADGWFIKEYGCAQVTMNLTDYTITPPHLVYDKVCELAKQFNCRVTGSELIGLIPKKALIAAGKYYLSSTSLTQNISESHLIETAVHHLGLSERSVFLPQERIIEYVLTPACPQQTLVP